MSRDFPVKGLEDVMNVLTLLPKNMQTNGVRQMLTAMADPIVKEARERAMAISPKIAKAIRKGSPRKNQDGTFSIRVYVDEKREDGWLGYLFEHGIRPHEIKLKRSSGGKAGRNAAARDGAKAIKIGERFVSGIISHPGVRPHPFLIPALDIRADDAVQAGQVKLAQFVEGKTGFAAPLDEAA